MKIAISVNRDGQDPAGTQKLKATTLERIDQLITSNWDDKKAKKSTEIEKYKIDLEEAQTAMQGGLQDVNQAISALLQSKVRRFAKRDNNSEAMIDGKKSIAALALDTTKITGSKTPLQAERSGELPGTFVDSNTVTPRGIVGSQEGLIPEDIAGEERSAPYIKTTTVLPTSPRKSPRVIPSNP